MKSIALFGGSFDPPHIGHMAIVEALEELGYIDKIIVMPTYLNPFKSSFSAPAELRFKWLEDIFKDSKNVIVDKYEVNQNRAVSTIQSVEYLLKRYNKIYLVIGADNLAALELWNNYESLKEKVTFLVASRDNIIIDDHFIQLKVNENISSTQLREKINDTKLPLECADQIKEFYKENNER